MLSSASFLLRSFTAFKATFSITALTSSRLPFPSLVNCLALLIALSISYCLSTILRSIKKSLFCIASVRTDARFLVLSLKLSIDSLSCSTVSLSVATAANCSMCAAVLNALLRDSNICTFLYTLDISLSLLASNMDSKPTRLCIQSLALCIEPSPIVN